MKIEKMFAYVTIGADGTEKPCAFTGENGELVPLMGAHPELMKLLRPSAEMLVRQTGKDVRLIEFVTRIEGPKIGALEDVLDRSSEVDEAWERSK